VVCESLRNGIRFGTTEIHVLRLKEGIEPKFLWYALRSKRFRDGAEAAMRGSAGQQRVPSEFIANYEIPDYDLDKQREIVDYIESYLSNIREASQRCRH
jgi:type I restriction enzyme S subunit